MTTQTTFAASTKATLSSCYASVSQKVGTIKNKTVESYTTVSTKIRALADRVSTAVCKFFSSLFAPITSRMSKGLNYLSEKMGARHYAPLLAERDTKIADLEKDLAKKWF